MDDVDLTFFVWADTHFGYRTSFDGDIRANIIKQMNLLPSWPMPAEIGGVVNEPEFVVLCGDAIDGEESRTHLEFDYYRYFINQLNYPHYEVIGNHDEFSPFIDYFVQRYGDKSYSFEKQGIHFISLHSDYDEFERGSVNSEDLSWLESDLNKLDENVPVVLFIHTRIDSLKNSEDVMRVLKGSNVLLVISGHKHNPDVFELDGICCVSIGHCRDHPIDAVYGRNFYVVRIANDMIVALPWRWDIQDWETNRNLLLKRKAVGLF